MRTNLTLSLDTDLLRKSRKLAIDHSTSVNQVVRDYLRHFTREKDPGKATAAALKDFFQGNTVTIGKKKWTRDELYDRR